MLCPRCASKHAANRAIAATPVNMMQSVRLTEGRCSAWCSVRALCSGERAWMGRGARRARRREPRCVPWPCRWRCVAPCCRWGPCCLAGRCLRVARARGGSGGRGAARPGAKARDASAAKAAKVAIAAKVGQGSECMHECRAEAACMCIGAAASTAAIAKRRTCCRGMRAPWAGHVRASGTRPVLAGG